MSLDEEPVNVDVRRHKEKSKDEEAGIEEVDAALPEGHGVGDIGESDTEGAITEQDIPMIVVTNAADGSSIPKQRTAPTSSTSMDYLKVQSPNFQVSV